MSVDWVTIKATAKATVASLTGLPDAQVRWRDEPVGSTWGNVPMVLLRIAAISDVGIAEERRDQPTATDDAIVTVAQQKQFTLSIRCESFEQNIADPKHAGTIIGTLKTRLRRSSQIFGDRDGVFSICLYTPVKWFEYASDGRQVTCYVLDLICATVDNDVDTSNDAGDWIKEADISGTLDGVTAAVNVVA